MRGMLFCKYALAAATPLPSLTGYPTSFSIISTPARHPNNCNCQIVSNGNWLKLHPLQKKKYVCSLMAKRRHICTFRESENFSKTSKKSSMQAKVINNILVCKWQVSNGNVTEVPYWLDKGTIMGL